MPVCRWRAYARPLREQEKPQFAFKMRVAEKDREGYYCVRWDRATPLTVHAAGRNEAFRRAWDVMGKCPRRGFVWTAVIDSVEAVSS